MNCEYKISEELSPFFRFANPANPSMPMHTWTDSNQRIRTRLAYENCVSCNTKRFTTEELSDIRIGTDTYFCGSCFHKVVEIGGRYDKGIPSKEYEVFSKTWNDFLFGKQGP